MFDKLVYTEKLFLVDKKDYGMCYCGGGLRACVLTYGSIEANLENLHKVKYISGVSGSTWFITLYTYYNSKIRFHKVLNPEDCTLDNINYIETGTFGKTLSKVKLLSEYIENTIDFMNKKINTWNTVIYESFFEEYGNPDDIMLNLKNVPYPLIQSGIYYNDINERIFHAEFTPFYSSVPIYYEKNNISYGGYNIENKKFCKNHEILPYIQSGISSSAIVSVAEQITGGKYTGTIYELLNPNTNQINEADLADGGYYDNTGVIGLLRRKTKNIHLNLFPEGSIKDKIYKIEYFISYFKGHPNSEKYGIFPLGLWEEIYNRLMYKLNNGEPLTVLMKDIQIESNEYFQIEGYGPVNLLLHISSCPTQWYDKLPSSTQIYIRENESDFPNISTIKLKLESSLINLMYSVIAWDIKNSEEYKEFYSLDS